MPLPFIGALLAKAIPLIKGVATGVGGALAKVGKVVAPIAAKVGGFVKNNIGTIGKVASAMAGMGGSRRTPSPSDPRVEEPPDEAAVAPESSLPAIMGPSSSGGRPPPPPSVVPNGGIPIPAGAQMVGHSMSRRDENGNLVRVMPFAPIPAAAQFPLITGGPARRGHMSREQRSIMEFNPPRNKGRGPHAPITVPGPPQPVTHPVFAPPPSLVYRPIAKSPSPQGGLSLERRQNDAATERINALRGIGGPLMQKIMSHMPQIRDYTVSGVRPAI